MNLLLKTHEETINNFAENLFENKEILVLGGDLKEAEFLKSKKCKSITIVNISEKEIEKSKSFYPPNTMFILGDAEKMSLKNNSFDIIFSSAILHHLDLDEILKESIRLLKNRGKLFIYREPILLNPIAFIGRKFFPSNIHTPTEHPFIAFKFRKKLKQYGFKEIKFKYFFLFSHSVPIFAKIISFNKLTYLLKFLQLIDNMIMLTPLKEFAWFFSAIYEKNN